MPIYNFPTDIEVGDAGQTTWANEVGTALNTLGPLVDSKLNTADAPELIRDTMATALTAGTNISITPNDAGDTITVATPDATTSVKGAVQLTNHLGGTATAPTVRSASTALTGIVELADNTETQTGTDNARAITPASLSSRSATESRTGLAEIATTAEVTTGTDDTRIVTPAKLKPQLDGKANTVHTHTASQVTDFQAATVSVVENDSAVAEFIRDTMGGTLVAGSNVTITPNDVSNTITIAASGGGGGGSWAMSSRSASLTGRNGLRELQGGWLNSAPIFIPASLTITSIGFEVTTAGATPSSVIIGLYSVASSGLGTLAHTFGELDTTTTGQKMLTGSWTVTAGTYYLALLSKGNAPTTGSTDGKAAGLAVVLPAIGDWVQGRRHITNSGATVLPATINPTTGNGAVGQAFVPSVEVVVS